MTAFKRAVRTDSRLRMALIGPAGSGKTYTALSIASSLGGKVAVIDTERGSASKYSGNLFDFDVLELTSFAPERYVEGIKDASDAGYGVLIIDSLSHAWSGKDGLLEFVDKEAAKSTRGNSFGAWRNATPKHNALVDAMLGADLHVIVTMRAKTEYVQEVDERTKKTVVRKVGMAPVQRDGLEYEFDVVGDLDQENNLIVTKSRCPELSGEVVNRAGAQVAGTLKAWLGTATPEDAAPAPKGPEPVKDALKTISPAAATRLRTKIADLKVGWGTEAQFIESAIGLSSVEEFGDLNAEQAAAVWQHATSLAAKAESKPVYETWAKDADAQGYGAALARDHGVFGSGSELMTAWESVKQANKDPALLYREWFGYLDERRKQTA